MKQDASTPVIITCALVGAELSREQVPGLPLQPREIIDSAIGAWKAGASIVHVHVRDAFGRPTCDLEIFREVAEGIRGATDLILQVSTGGAVGDSIEQRLQPLQCRPEMASLTLGSVNFGEEVFLNPQPWIRRLATAMRDLSVKPEVEIFDAAMISNARKLQAQGLLAAPLHFGWVMGVPGAIAADERHLDFLLQGLEEGDTWSLAAIGKAQFPMLASALKKGGHVRVGMEDNPYLEKGVLAESNAQLVRKLVSLVESSGRGVAKPAQARRLLKL